MDEVVKRADILRRNSHNTKGFLCVFDLDGTLTKYNSTFGFVELFLARTMRHRYILFKILKAPVMFVTVIARRVLSPNADFYRAFAIKLLDGCDRSELYRIAREYVEVILEDMKTRLTFELLEQMRLCSKVVIVTKTLDPLQCLGELIDVTVITSTLNYSGSRATGRVYDLEKAYVIDQIIRSSGVSPLMIVSDVSEDLTENFPIRLLASRDGRIRLVRERGGNDVEI